MDETQGRFEWAVTPVSFSMYHTSSAAIPLFFSGDTHYLSSYYLLKRFCKEIDIADRDDLIGFIGSISASTADGKNIPGIVLVSGNSTMELNLLKDWCLAKFSEEGFFTAQVDISYEKEASLEEALLSPFGDHYKGDPILADIPNYYRDAIAELLSHYNKIHISFYFEPGSIPESDHIDFFNFLNEFYESIAPTAGERIFITVFMNNGKIESAQPLFDGGASVARALTTFPLSDFSKKDIIDFFARYFAFGDTETLKVLPVNPEDFYCDTDAYIIKRNGLRPEEYRK
jgi:hypothetical protein